jgi:hypothetical protein
MKNLFTKSLLTFFLAVLFFMNPVFSDPPGPPGPGGDPGGSGGVPVGSPIDNSTIVLLVLALVYGVYKIYEFRKKRPEESTEQ